MRKEASHTSSTRGRTAGGGNRATVFLMKASFFVWKIFWKRIKEEMRPHGNLSTFLFIISTQEA